MVHHKKVTNAMRKRCRKKIKGGVIRKSSRTGRMKCMRPKHR